MCPSAATATTTTAAAGMARANGPRPTGVPSSWWAAIITAVPPVQTEMAKKPIATAMVITLPSTRPRTPKCAPLAIGSLRPVRRPKRTSGRTISVPTATPTRIAVQAAHQPRP